MAIWICDIFTSYILIDAMKNCSLELGGGGGGGGFVNEHNVPVSVNSNIVYWCIGTSNF